MSRVIEASMRGRRKYVILLLLLSTGLLWWQARPAQAAPYANPFWTSVSPSPESAIGSVAARAITPESVDARTGELIWGHFLFRTPGLKDDNLYGLTWRSMQQGATQFGNGWNPWWDLTSQYVLINAGNPNAPGGHAVDIRRASGRIDRFQWDGVRYVPPPDVFDALNLVVGFYQLSDPQGNTWHFGALGMLKKFVDDNLNQTTFSRIGYRLTGITDDRGKTYFVTSNARGYISSITDFAGRTWTLTYDVNDNLRTITTPAPSTGLAGIVTTFTYDGLNRLVAINDGRGNTVKQFAYLGVTGQVASVTINGSPVTMSYLGGRTDRTDRNGNVHRTFFTGQQVTQTDQLVQGAAKHTKLYRYNGVFLGNVVFPRGNRIDFAYDAVGNLLSRRHREQDTATDQPSDLVHMWAYNAKNFPTSYTDPRGNLWQLGRDTFGNLTSVTHPQVMQPTPQNAIVFHTYNTSGQRVSTTDEEGRLTQYCYGTAGNGAFLLTKVAVDPTDLDLETLFTHDAMGNVATRTDPRGKVFSNTWDKLRRLTETTAPSPLSYRVRREYDGNNNLTKKEVENYDKDGTLVASNPWITTTYAYTVTDDLQVWTEEVDESTTRSTQLEYDPNQNRIRVTKPEGNKNYWEYDERDLVTKKILGEGDVNAVSVLYVHDDNGNQTKITNGRSFDTTFAYDLFDRRTRRTNALGHLTEYTRDANGNIVKVERSSAAGGVLQRESYSIDERNRRFAISALYQEPGTTHTDAYTQIHHDRTGLVVQVTDPRNNTRTNLYDAARRRTKSIDALGNEMEWDRDENGNATAWRIKETDGLTTVTHEYEAEYDALNRRVKRTEIDRLNASNRLDTLYGHDSRGNPVWQVNAEGNPTRRVFDGLNRLIRRERALQTGASLEEFLQAQVTTWGFDRNNRLASHTDDGANTSTWDYDALDRKVKMTYPDSKFVTWQHDAAHNVIQTVDPAGNQISDTFDALNRNTMRSITRAAGFLGTTSEERTFDALNRIVQNSDNDYRLDYEYAVIGFKSYVAKEKQQYLGQTAYSKSVTKSYDVAGNRLTEQYAGGANLTLSFASDAINQLLAIDDGTNTLASYAHLGRRAQQTNYQSGATSSTSYSGFRNEVASIQHKTGWQATILRLDYGYNKVHDRTYERFGAAGAVGDAFEYDKMRRLTKVYVGSATPPTPAGNAYVKTIDYNYDDDGNRQSVVTTLWQQAATTSGYTTNNLNQYTQVGATNRTHDANGNLINDGVRKYEYNYKNLIVKARWANDNSLIATYKYDAEGRRVEKAVVNGAFERYIRSRARETAGSHRVANNPGKGGRYDMSQVVSVYASGNAWKQNFVWGSSIDQIEVLEQKDLLDYDSDTNVAEITRSFYHRNALGSVMEITDANQLAVVSYRYNPYGAQTITRNGQLQTTDPLQQHWGYTGRFADEETELWYYRARYYDAWRGRMITRDPAGYLAGPSLYAYAASRAVVLRDPSGLDPSKFGHPGDPGVQNCAKCGGSPHRGYPPADYVPLWREVWEIFWTPERKDNINDAKNLVPGGVAIPDIPGGTDDVKEQAQNDRTDDLERKVEALERKVEALEAAREKEEPNEEDEDGGVAEPESGDSESEAPARAAIVLTDGPDDGTDTNQDGVSDAVEEYNRSRGGLPNERGR